jgi:hypothetical protein
MQLKIATHAEIVCSRFKIQVEVKNLYDVEVKILILFK